MGGARQVFILDQIQRRTLIFTLILRKGSENARHRESLEVHLVALCKTELLHIQEFIEAEHDLRYLTSESAF